MQRIETDSLVNQSSSVLKIAGLEILMTIKEIFPLVYRVRKITMPSTLSGAGSLP